MGVTLSKPEQVYRPVFARASPAGRAQHERATALAGNRAVVEVERPGDRAGRQHVLHSQAL
ncbi:Uncharacterised protein [Mycobacteroides abscessus subsp. abscessus]|nr:Uncharacterised protein [Mycobacteroides abscessus subsp. abscessus]